MKVDRRRPSRYSLGNDSVYQSDCLNTNLESECRPYQVPAVLDKSRVDVGALYQVFSCKKATRRRQMPRVLVCDIHKNTIADYVSPTTPMTLLAFMAIVTQPITVRQVCLALVCALSCHRSMTGGISAAGGRRIDR